MQCPKCGNQLNPQARFCNFCGTQIQSSQQPQYQQSQYQQPQYRQPQYQQSVQQPVYQQPVYRQPVQQPQAQPPKKKKFPILLIAILAAVVVVIGVAVLLLTGVLGKKTVYLVTEQVTETSMSTITKTYDYTEDGKIRFVQTETEYSEDYSYMEDTCISWTYEYGKDGKIFSAEYSYNGEAVEFEYVYDDEGNLEAIEGDPMEVEVTCNKDGYIVEIESKDSDSYSAKYSYHENGVLKKAQIDMGTYVMEYRYDDQGRMIRNEIIYNGLTANVTEQEYDEKGHLVKVVSESYSDGVLAVFSVQEYIYDDQGNWVEFYLETGDDEESATLIFEVQGDEREKDLMLVDVEGSGMELPDEEEIMAQVELIQMEYYYDEFGNMTGTLVDMNGNGTSSETEYMELKVPQSYVKPIEADPIYFQSIGSAG